jgi:hypothetical protein
VGKNEDLIEVMNLISTFGSELGLILNLNKCVAYSSPGVSNNLPANIQRASDGLIVLGSPIGSQSFVSSTVKCVIDNIAGTMVKCRKLENPQEELLLLRNCTGAPKVIY